MVHDRDGAGGALSVLEDTLAGAFNPDAYGFPWYSSIDDRAVRAVRSNQALGPVDAATAHLGALVDPGIQVRVLVGPNGRTMPTAEEIAERATIERIYVEITDALRAAGSLLDVLGGLVTLFLGLRVPPSFADTRQLLRCSPEPVTPSPQQAAAISRTRDTVSDAVGAGPDGWLEWLLESRNALVHRGRSSAIWLPVRKSTQRRGVMVVTHMAPERVVRGFPQLRRQPDLSDAESVLTGNNYEQVYLREPAQDTLDDLARRCAAVAATIADALHGLIAEMPAFVWPTTEWQLTPRTDRARAADAFAGFRPDRAGLDIDQITLNQRDATRLLTMDRLRQELQSSS